MSDAFDDIANAIDRLRRAFKAHRFEAPKAIELGSHDDMVRLRAVLPRGHFVSVAEGKPWLVTNILGVDILAPGELRARKRGGFDVE